MLAESNNLYGHLTGSNGQALPELFNNITVVCQNGSKPLGQITHKANMFMFCQTYIRISYPNKAHALWCRIQSLCGGTCGSISPSSHALSCCCCLGCRSTEETKKSWFSGMKLIPKHLSPPLHTKNSEPALCCTARTLWSPRPCISSQGSGIVQRTTCR